MQWLYLGLAIISEVIATSSLKAAEGFTRPIPSVVVIIGYGVSFYLLSLTLRSIPIGITYAIWSGVGLALISLVGWVVYQQRLDVASWIGIGLIVSGVLVIHLFSKSVSH